MRQDRIINVFFHDRLVGTLAMTNERKAAFEYAYDELKKENVQDKVTLFYNDYDTYFSVDDELALISYINEGEEEKICGGIGMQSHITVSYPSLEKYGTAVDKF